MIHYSFLGCFFNRFVDWRWACKTNTLGWEQCDVMKREKMNQDEAKKEKKEREEGIQ